MCRLSKSGSRCFVCKKNRLLLVKFMSKKLIAIIGWILDACNKASSSKEPEYVLNFKQAQNLSHCSGNNLV